MHNFSRHVTQRDSRTVPLLWYPCSITLIVWPGTELQQPQTPCLSAWLAFPRLQSALGSLLDIPRYAVLCYLSSRLGAIYRNASHLLLAKCYLLRDVHLPLSTSSQAHVPTRMTQFLTAVPQPGVLGSRPGAPLLYTGLKVWVHVAHTYTCLQLSCPSLRAPCRAWSIQHSAFHARASRP